MKTVITKLENQLLTAIQNRDIKFLNELLHDDLLFVIPTGQTVTKEMDLANLESGNLKIDHISSEEQTINLIEDCAIVSVVINLKGSYLDQPIDGKFKYIRTWKQFENNWKVIGGAGMTLQE